MNRLARSLIAALFALLIASQPLAAATSPTVPFDIVVQGEGWTVDDSKLEEIAKQVFLAASVIHVEKELKATVFTGPSMTSPSALDNVCAGIRDSFTNPAVKKLADEKITYLGQPGQLLIYEVRQEGTSPTYNEARVFFVAGRPWVLSISGPLTQKEAVKEMLTFFHPKKP